MTARELLLDAAEIEVICRRCGYLLKRTAARLRRDTPVVCPNCGEQVVPPPPTANAYFRESE
jgi:rubrerythrin